jgi:hypothetical protein
LSPKNNTITPSIGAIVKYNPQNCGTSLGGDGEYYTCDSRIDIDKFG